MQIDWHRALEQPICVLESWFWFNALPGGLSHLSKFLRNKICAFIHLHLTSQALASYVVWQNITSSIGKWPLELLKYIIFAWIFNHIIVSFIISNMVKSLIKIDQFLQTLHVCNFCGYTFQCLQWGTISMYKGAEGLICALMH